MVETIGIRIQYLREKVYSFSQEEFAKKLGVSQRTISGMENDDVSAKNILKLESMG
jgi:DNA-binding XRE family transcriptional regulator